MLTGAFVSLSGEILDHIDDVFLPGTDVGFSEAGFVPQSLSDTTLPRRVPGDRTAETAPTMTDDQLTVPDATIGASR